MAKAVKKAPARKPASKAGPAAKSKPKAPKKAIAGKKRLSRLERLEGAILATVAEADELVLEMGLAGAVPPGTKRSKNKR